LLFHSIVFISVFLPAVFLAYTVIRGQNARNILLIAANLFFYTYGQEAYVLLLILSASFHYFIGRMLSGPRRKLCLGFCVAADILLLFVFKYLSFAVGAVNQAAGTHITVPQLAMPVGISFFTFQALSYVIDVYREPELCEKRFDRVFLYITLFPQLLAGPIIRFKDIRGELAGRCQSLENVSCGIRRFIQGVIIADTVAKIANGVFALPSGDLNCMTAWAGAAAYTLQIYFDFSGYSDMAIGLAQMFGFHYKENFHYPYMAVGIKDFWRRWHISLSGWFRDYLYIPLGGNRKGRKRTILNKYIVFFITGLWHGANWTFIVWGLMHGTCAVIEDAARGRAAGRPGKFWKHVLTIAVVITTFAVFRSDSLGSGLFFIGKMFAGFSISASSRAALLRLMTPFTVTAFLLGIVFSFPVLEKLRTMHAGSALRLAGDAGILLLLFLSMAMISSGGYSPFIYFKF